MSLQELFDLLLEERQITVPGSKSELESLRVQLAKKWKQYRDSLDSCGFLSDELATCGISRKSGDGVVIFSLSPVTRKKIEYQIIRQQHENVREYLAGD